MAKGDRDDTREPQTFEELTQPTQEALARGEFSRPASGMYGDKPDLAAVTAFEAPATQPTDIFPGYGTAGNPQGYGGTPGPPLQQQQVNSLVQPPGSEALQQYTQQYLRQQPETIDKLKQNVAERERLGMQPFPKPPTPPRLQNYPAPPKDTYRSVLQASQAPLIFMTLMGSLMSKNHGMGAMAAATGYMEGFQEGDKAKVERNRQIWKDQVEQLTKQNDLELERYKMAWDKPTYDMKERLAHINVLATSFDDQIKINAVQAGDVRLLDNIMRDTATANYRLKYAGGISQFGGGNPEAFENTAQMIAKGNSPPPSLTTNIMRNPGALESYNNLMKRVREINPEFRSDDFRNAQLGRQRGTSGQQGNTIRRFDVAMSHLAVLEELGDALHNGQTVRANQLKQYLGFETGHPEPTDFDAARRIVGAEVAQAVVGAGGTGEERKAASDAFERMRSPQQLHGAIETVKRLIAGQLGGMRNQFTGGKHPIMTVEEFNSRLYPETLQELDRYGARPGITVNPARGGYPAAEPATGGWGKAKVIGE